jgi:hypothetical protein
VNRTGAAFLALLLGVALLLSSALGCGKYGPPVRAGAEEVPARKPSFEVPLPLVPEQAAPEAAPAVPEVEEEPPPEGTP